MLMMFHMLNNCQKIIWKIMYIYKILITATVIPAWFVTFVCESYD